MINIKKTPVLLLVLFCFSSAYAQSEKESFEYFTKDEMIQYLMNSGAQIDSLQKKVIEPLNDSISGLISSYSKKNSALSDSISNHNDITRDLKKQILGLEFTVTELNKNKVKEERDSLVEEVSSLKKKVDEQEKIMKRKADIRKGEKAQSLIDLNEARKTGKQEVLNRIINTYQKPLDSLIKSSSLKTVEDDMNTVRGEISGTDVLFELQKYFKSEQILNEKFNEQSVVIELDNIGELEKTELVKRLSKNITSYKYLNEDLKKTIQRIILEDKSFIAYNSESESQKKGKIFSELASFIYNYDFNFTDYPYLSGIVLEIINQKQKDPNTDINYLLNKL